MNEKQPRQFNVIPPVEFKYVFKNKKNHILFTNEIKGGNWFLLNKTYKKINTYDDILLLHD